MYDVGPFSSSLNEGNRKPDSITFCPIKYVKVPTKRQLKQDGNRRSAEVTRNIRSESSLEISPDPRNLDF